MTLPLLVVVAAVASAEWRAARARELDGLASFALVAFALAACAVAALEAL